MLFNDVLHFKLLNTCNNGQWNIIEIVLNNLIHIAFKNSNSFISVLLRETSLIKLLTKVFTLSGSHSIASLQVVYRYTWSDILNYRYLRVDRPIKIDKPFEIINCSTNFYARLWLGVVDNLFICHSLANAIYRNCSLTLKINLFQLPTT